MSDKPDIEAIKEEFFKEHVCRVLVEANGPYGDQLASLIVAALAQIERVEPMINQMSGYLNPYLLRQDPQQSGILGARPPTHVILLNTRFDIDEPAEMVDDESNVLIVALTIMRPEPFICMMQRIIWVPVTQLEAFAANVVNALNEHPRDGIAEFLKMREMLLKLVIDGS